MARRELFVRLLESIDNIALVIREAD